MTSRLQLARDQLVDDFYRSVEQLYQKNMLYGSPEEFLLAVKVKLATEKSKTLVEESEFMSPLYLQRLEDHKNGRASMPYVDPVLPRSIEKDKSFSPSAIAFYRPIDVFVTADVFDSINEKLKYLHQELDAIYQEEPPHPLWWR